MHVTSAAKITTALKLASYIKYNPADRFRTRKSDVGNTRGDEMKAFDLKKKSVSTARIIQHTITNGYQQTTWLSSICIIHDTMRYVDDM